MSKYLPTLSFVWIRFRKRRFVLPVHPQKLLSKNFFQNQNFKFWQHLPLFLVSPKKMKKIPHRDSKIHGKTKRGLRERMIQCLPWAKMATVLTTCVICVCMCEFISGQCVLFCYPFWIVNLLLFEMQLPHRACSIAGCSRLLWSSSCFWLLTIVSSRGLE